MRRTITIECGDELLAGLRLSPAEFAEEARFLLAAKLYELGRVTAGQAAELCNKTRIEFLFALPRAGVSVSNLHPEDSDAEVAFGCGG